MLNLIIVENYTVVLPGINNHDMVPTPETPSRHPVLIDSDW